MSVPPSKVAAARVARAHRNQDAAEIESARRDLAAIRISEYVAKVVAAAPPLTPEQVMRISRILKAGENA
jgi:hypothetical protein